MLGKQVFITPCSSKNCTPDLGDGSGRVVPGKGNGLLERQTMSTRDPSHTVHMNLHTDQTDVWGLRACIYCGKSSTMLCTIFFKCLMLLIIHLQLGKWFATMYINTPNCNRSCSPAVETGIRDTNVMGWQHIIWASLSTRCSTLYRQVQVLLCLKTVVSATYFIILMLSLSASAKRSYIRAELLNIGQSS